MGGCKRLTRDEMDKVLGSFNGMNSVRDKALFTLGCFTGFRISELLSLTLGDVFQHGSLVDMVHVKRKNTKGKLQGRSQPLHPEAKEALRIWVTVLHGRNDTTSMTPLFCSFNHGSRSITSHQAWVILKNAYEKALISGKTGTHCMRKSFAHNVYQALGKDLVQTKQALGHKSFDSTVSYLEVDQAEINVAILNLVLK
jgi:site-specific recombinase XerD